MKNKSFTKSDLKIGYIVICKDEPHMVMGVDNGYRVLVDKAGECLLLGSYDENLNEINPGLSGYWTITKVYGYRNWPTHSCDISTDNRPLLWERKDPVKKMTVEEIEKELGYKIEIISGEDKK